MSGVYCIRCLANGRVYVGSSVDIRKRWREHWGGLNRGDHPNRRLLNAWRKHGPDRFEFAVLEETPAGRLIEREQFHIDRLKAASRRHGLNISPTAGSPLGVIVAPATRAKISKANRIALNRPGTRAALSESGRRAWADEKTRKAKVEKTREVVARDSYRETLRESTTRLWGDPEYRAKLAAIQGSAEYREKMAMAIRGKKRTPEHRAKISAAIKAQAVARAAAMKARWADPEYRAKQSAANKGKTLPPEQKAKMAEARRKWWERKRAQAREQE